MTELSILPEAIAAKFWTDPAFHKDLELLYNSAVSSSISPSILGAVPPSVGVDEKLFCRLLQAAHILAQCQDAAYRHTAYRTAVATIRCAPSNLTNVVRIAHLILGKLGNFPAVDYIYRFRRIENDYIMPKGALFDLLFHEQTNTVYVKERRFVFTDFQARLWHRMAHGTSLSISAPTSAGKSFVLEKFLINALLNSGVKAALYLVPSRALITQVSEAFQKELKNFDANILVSTIPELPKEEVGKPTMFVLTQERAHVLLEENTSLTFEIAVVDEAQMLGSGSRGILLETVIDLLLTRNANLRIFFGAPFVTNPELFSYMFSNKRCDSIKEMESPVVQNLISIDIDKMSLSKVSLKLHVDGKFQPILETDLKVPLVDDRQSLAFLSFYFGRDSKNIVYAGSPGECENIADLLRQHLEDNRGDAPIDANLLELAALVRDHIHPNYYLAEMIESGVAFHFGNMPTILRRAIEHYFAEAPALRFIVCTSTLLYGVNLPASNIFMLKPSEGDRWLTVSATPISPPSFWNLAGRAGRLGKDLDGNVFLINRGDWKADPMMGSREQTIRSSLYDVLEKRFEDVLRLASEFPTKETDREVESAFARLFSDFRGKNLDTVLARAPVPVDGARSVRLSAAFEAIKVDVPEEISRKNIGISILRQQKMYEYVKAQVDAGDVTKLIPLHPAASGAYVNYVRLFSRFEKYFEGRAKVSAAPKRLSVIAIAWMKGTPYPEIIKGSQKAYPSKSLPLIVRETMETIERDLRFKCVEQARCYIDILAYTLSKSSLESLVLSIPALTLYLELGASSHTMVNLIGLGLSRTTAGLVNEKAANHQMDRDQCVRWMRRQQWDKADLPNYCKREISLILSSLPRT
jgi:hypothetical protein